MNEQISAFYRAVFELSKPFIIVFHMRKILSVKNKSCRSSFSLLNYHLLDQTKCSRSK